MIIIIINVKSFLERNFCGISIYSFESNLTFIKKKLCCIQSHWWYTTKLVNENQFFASPVVDKNNVTSIFRRIYSGLYVFCYFALFTILSIGKRSNLAKKGTEEKLKIVYKEYLTLHCEKYGFFKVDIWGKSKCISICFYVLFVSFGVCIYVCSWKSNFEQ